MDVIAAFDEWQLEGSSDTKSSVAISIALDVITIGLIYSEPANLPGAFSSFYKLPALQVAVPGFNTTFAFINQIVTSTLPSTTARYVTTTHLYKVQVY